MCLWGFSLRFLFFFIPSLPLSLLFYILYLLFYSVFSIRICFTHSGVVRLDCFVLKWIKLGEKKDREMKVI